MCPTCASNHIFQFSNFSQIIMIIRWCRLLLAVADDFTASFNFSRTSERAHSFLSHFRSFFAVRSSATVPPPNGLRVNLVYFSPFCKFDAVDKIIWSKFRIRKNWKFCMEIEYLACEFVWFFRPLLPLTRTEKSHRARNEVCGGIAKPTSEAIRAFNNI